jgi:hypothetical protein
MDGNCVGVGLCCTGDNGGRAEDVVDGMGWDGRMLVSE